jgi:hypothetical protein
MAKTAIVSGALEPAWLTVSQLALGEKVEATGKFKNTSNGR